MNLNLGRGVEELEGDRKEREEYIKPRVRELVEILEREPSHRMIQIQPRMSTKSASGQSELQHEIFELNSLTERRKVSGLRDSLRAQELALRRRRLTSTSRSLASKDLKKYA